MADTKGKIVAIYGNLVTAEVTGSVRQNAVAYCCRSRDGVKLKAEIIRLRNQYIDMQVFEATRGLKVGDEVEITSGLLSVTLGPGLLGQIYDGLQNPLPQLAEECGFFLQSGIYKDPLSKEVKWKFTPCKKVGDTVRAGDYFGTVPEGIFTHQIIVPPSFSGELTVEKIAKEGEYTIEEKVVTLKDSSEATHELGMSYEWPVKRPMKGYKDRLLPKEPLITKQRIIDSFFPICKGGTYCIPGPFGAGKTVMQQITSRHAEVDVVIIAACGERAGEVVETLREFPELTDPKTGRPLMERTIIICNTSSMPVAAREASVYTGITLAEYYRLMGLDVLLLADSTSRWAQALREMSGRLEEIPGEEAFPAYLESVIASFYERAGLVELRSGKKGSVTVGGTVSPAGGNFEEPVTQATLKVVGAFHGLSRARADARRFPSMDPIESWSKYKGGIDEDDVVFAKNILRSGNEVGQMMTVVGEEGVSIDDFILFLKAELLDRVYLQQNAFNDIDAACSLDRQKHTFAVLLDVLNHEFSYESKDAARTGFFQLQEAFLNWNLTEWESQAFKDQESKVKGLL